MLSGFGGTYKRNPLIKSERWVQELCYKKRGYEEVEKFWTGVFDLFAPKIMMASESMAKYLQNALQASWMFGLECSAHSVSGLPNGLGAFRLLIAGEIGWVLIEISEVVAAFRTLLSTEKLAMTEVVRQLEQMSTLDFLNLQQTHGMPHCLDHSAPQ